MKINLFCTTDTNAMSHIKLHKLTQTGILTLTKVTWHLTWVNVYVCSWKQQCCNLQPKTPILQCKLHVNATLDLLVFGIMTDVANGTN